MSKNDNYEVVPVTEDEARTNPDRKGKWKIVRKGDGQQINGDFSAKEEAEKHLNELFPDPEPKPEIESEPELEPEQEEESGTSPFER